MLNSFMSLMGTPLANTPAANVTIKTSTSLSSCRRNSTSNSTAFELDGSSYEVSNEISSPSISPVKERRENAMESSYCSSSSSHVSEENVSLNLKHNINNVDLDNPEFQKIAIRYLLEKVRDQENLLIRAVKDNNGLREDISQLYRQNDALAAENVNVQDVISSNYELKMEVESLKKAFAIEREILRDTLSKNAIGMREDVKSIYQGIKSAVDDIDTLHSSFKEIQKKSCHNQIQVESLKDANSEMLTQIQNELVRLEKNITVTNQYSRRENLVIDGIPENVLQENLEDICLDIIHSIGFHQVGNYKVVGCHRLKKTEKDTVRPVIIRFINRKVPEYCKYNKWRLKNLNYFNWNLSIREDLCEANQAILAKCEELKVQGHLKKVFTYNGFVKVALDQGRAVKLSHMKDLTKMLPGISF